MCQIEITPDRLNRFPKTVPMNIREAILIVIQALPRILTERKNQKAMTATDEKSEPEEMIQKPAPAPAKAGWMPYSRRGRLRETFLISGKPSP